MFRNIELKWVKTCFNAQQHLCITSALTLIVALLTAIFNWRRFCFLQGVIQYKREKVTEILNGPVTQWNAHVNNELRSMWFVWARRFKSKMLVTLHWSMFSQSKRLKGWLAEYCFAASSFVFFLNFFLHYSFSSFGLLWVPLDKAEGLA